MFLYENDLPLDGVQVPVQSPEAGPGRWTAGPAAGHDLVHRLGCVLWTLQPVPLLYELNHLPQNKIRTIKREPLNVRRKTWLPKRSNN